MLSAAYVVQSQHLGMRRLTVEDVEPLRRVIADPYASRFYQAMNQTESLERWIAWNLKNYEDFGFGIWAVELLETGVFIGDAGITFQTVEGERILEIGWHIHLDFRNRGFATEAGVACLHFGFGALGASVIGSIVDPKNLASRKVAERVHAEQREYKAKGGPMLLFSTSASQYKARPNPSLERTSTSKALGPRGG
jgi:RimJ/RimL family protein N-acetyltransferase